MTDTTMVTAPTKLQAILNSWLPWRWRLTARAEPGSGRPSEPLLEERMRQLGVSRTAVESANPAVMRGLERACASCALRSQCSHDLGSERSAPAVAAYCPNERTLQALREVRSDRE